MPAREPTAAGTPSRGTLPSAPSSTMVLIGILVAIILVGLVAPSAEEPEAVADGFRRAAYWACADVLTQRVGPAIDLEFPGDSTAAITNQGQIWDVEGRVDIVSGRVDLLSGRVETVNDLEPVPRTWRCTVTHDDGNWRGTALLD